MPPAAARVRAWAVSVVTWLFLPGRHDVQLARAAPADHVHVEVGLDCRHRDRRIGQEGLGAKKALLFAAHPQEGDGTPWVRRP